MYVIRHLPPVALGMEAHLRPAARALLVDNVSPDGAALHAGIRPGDLITAINGQSARDAGALLRAAQRREARRPRASLGPARRRDPRHRLDARRSPGRAARVRQHLDALPSRAVLRADAQLLSAAVPDRRGRGPAAAARRPACLAPCADARRLHRRGAHREFRVHAARVPARADARVLGAAHGAAARGDVRLLQRLPGTLAARPPSAVAEVVGRHRDGPGGDGLRRRVSCCGRARIR